MPGPLFLAGAAVAVLVLIALSARFGHHGTATLDDEVEAREIADTLPGGFVARSAVLSADGTAALVRDGEGRVALVAPHGAHFVAHLLWPSDSVERNGAVLRIQCGARDVALDLGAAAGEWHDAVQSQVAADD